MEWILEGGAAHVLGDVLWDGRSVRFFVEVPSLGAADWLDAEAPEGGAAPFGGPAVLFSDEQRALLTSILADVDGLLSRVKRMAWREAPPRWADEPPTRHARALEVRIPREGGTRARYYVRVVCPWTDDRGLAVGVSASGMPTHTI